MNYEYELIERLPGRAAGQGSVCLFRKTVWRGRCSVYMANSGGIDGIRATFRPVRE